MNRRVSRAGLSLMLLGTALSCQRSKQGSQEEGPPPRSAPITIADMQAARAAQGPQLKGVNQKFAGLNPGTLGLSPLTSGAPQASTMVPPVAPGVLATPDYFAVPNWANSPLPTVGPGPVIGITLLSGGGGYQNPVVTITDTPPGTGSGATASATAVAGVITQITVTAGGTNYSAPVVTITDANGISAGARAFVSSFGAVTGGMRKFVDTLPGLCSVSGANDLGQCIPIATADRTTFPGSDFYRVGLRDYSQQMHLDLPATRLRGYVPLDATNNPVYDPAAPGKQQYLGPFILAVRDRPVRLLLQNQLGTGTSGNLFLPVDTSYMGAGVIDDGTHMAMAAQNRATIHLHGGNTPWISDGTPHQWITPAGEPVPQAPGFAKGYSFQNVPDMPAALGFTASLSDGLATFLWTNQQSGRLMFVHDHSYGITRLNVYGGEAAGYLLLDPVEEDQLAAATMPGTLGATAGGTSLDDLAHLLPLVLQDKTFVPDNGAAGGQLAATDPTWDVANYGGLGSLWFPHVYMPNQNPYDNSGANPYGRWDYGPWFWPPQQGQAALTFPPVPCTSAGYPGAALTCPATPNPSGTPEGFHDTPVINGTAYPSLAVKPSAYRLQMLSVGNDRNLHLGLYYAIDRNGVACKPPNVFDAASCTEVSMVPAVPHTAWSSPPLCAQATAVAPGLQQAIAALDAGGNPINGTGLPANCWPTTWPTDGRAGGVPDPLTAGPPLVQIGAEGGLLPKVAVIPSTPMGYDYNRRNITVLNILTHGLLMGPAERADVVADFSGVPAGSVLIVYNDGPAPIPAFDPRFDYYTGDPDLTSVGGAPSTQPGYGPNTRTIMQIKVAGTNDNLAAFSLASLTAALPNIFAATQEKIIVPESAYPAANGGGKDTYARIQDNFLTGWFGGPLSALQLTNGGAGYTPPLAVTIAGGGGSGAAGAATLAPTTVAGLTLTSGGAGYTSLPTVAITGGGGSGATGAVTLSATGSVKSITVTNGGSGYRAAPVVNIVGSGAGAAATAVVNDRRVVAVVVTAAGAGYLTAPTVTFAPVFGGSGATARANLGRNVASISLTNGGAGYTSIPSVAITGGGGAGAAAAARLTPTVVASVALTNGGTGYTSPPTVTITAPTGAGATAVAVAPANPLQSKAIHELFSLDYGRMNALLGVELPLTNFTTQTTIPYFHADPPTEIQRDGEMQLWKITHNGVDTHVIHFHLFTVQLVNRVGWDGSIKPPDPNELGWKETLRMNPLEDVIVALKPMRQVDTLGITTGGVPGPFELPNSIRPLDVSMPLGSATPTEFTNVDPANQPAAVVNSLVNFGWEYMWHCHILGHEENDMMRVVAMATLPRPPSGLTATRAGSGSLQRATLTWTDGSVNETAFNIERATSANGPWTAIGFVPSTTGPGTGSRVSYVDFGLPRRTTLYYRVSANNTVGYGQIYAPPAVGYPTTSEVSAPTTPASIVTF